MKLKQLCLTLAGLLVAGGAYAADPKFAVIYDAGGKFDKSFNQSASEGAERFKKETKIGFMEVQVASDTQTEQVLRNLARKNVDLIAAIGFGQAQAVQNIAKEFPKTKFVLIDGVAAGNNVSSVLFKEQEGSYLVGVAAALAANPKNWFHRRHGYSADPQFLLRLYTRGKSHRWQSRSDPEYGWHHDRSMERSGQRRRTRARAV
jgi:basic membrane protein A